jgi:hypothetical protein
MAKEDHAAAVKRQEEADAAPPYEVSTAGPSSNTKVSVPSGDASKSQASSDQSGSGSAAPPVHHVMPEMDATPASQVSPQPQLVMVADAENPILADRIIKYRARMRLLEAYLYALCIYLVMAMLTGMVVDSAAGGVGNGGKHKHRHGDQPGLPPHWPPREGEW